jgi:hypothetical protein
MSRNVALFSSGVLAVTMLTVSEPSASATQFTTSVVLTDRSGDVWLDDDANVSFPPADVRRAVVRHATYAVRIRFRFVDLRRLGYQGFEATIETPIQAFAVAQVRSEPGLRSGRHGFLVGDLSNDPATGCPGMSHRINYATEVVRMRIPRSCLGRPNWVRVALYNSMTTTTADQPRPDDVYVDNPHDNQGFNGGSTERLFRE